MTPSEKAKKLVLKYLRLQEKDSYNWFNKGLAKQCALIAVDEIIKTYTNKDGTYFLLEQEVDYWQKVKEEIEKL